MRREHLVTVMEDVSRLCLQVLNSRLVILRQLGRGNPAPLEQLLMFLDRPEPGVYIFFIESGQNQLDQKLRNVLVHIHQIDI